MTGERELLAVLARVQAGTALLAGGGQAAVMGTPLYLVVPAAWAGTLLWCARAVRVPPGRRPLRLLRAHHALTLAGTVLGLLVGLTGWVAWTPTLTGLVTTVALPVVGLLLVARARRGAPLGVLLERPAAVPR